MADSRIGRNAPPITKSTKAVAPKETPSTMKQTHPETPAAKGWAPKAPGSRPRPAANTVAANTVKAPAAPVAKPVSGQSPAVKAQMDAEVNQAISFRHRGNDIPEKLLPTNHPAVEGNKVEHLVDGAQVFPKMFEDIRNAKDSIHISHFAIGNDKLGQEMGQLLMEKARSGVEVRVLFDPAGSGDLIGRGATENMVKEWKAAGIQVIRNDVINLERKAEMINHVDHQKMYVMDGKVAYTGGMGIQEKYRSEWHDTMTRVEGEGARQMQVDFVKKWQHLGGKIDQKGGTDEQLKARFFPEAGRPGDATVQGMVAVPGESHTIREALLKEINGAKKSFYVENPYFTDKRIIDALENAAKRGVDVRVVVPGKTDMPLTMWAARGEYDRLLKAGAHIYEYPKMTHTKVAIRDGEWSTFGSSNLDSLSMNHNYEFNYQTPDKKVSGTIQDMVKADMAVSKEMKVGDIKGMDKILGKILDSRVISYFL